MGCYELPTSAHICNDSAFEISPATSASSARVPESLSSPSLGDPLIRCLSSSSQRSIASDGAFSENVVTAMPEAANPQPPPITPPTDQSVESNMNLLVGGALAPTSTAQQTPLQSSRTKPGLRLPSFRQLGIATIQPDGISGIPSHGTGIDGKAESKYDQPAELVGDEHDRQSTAIATSLGAMGQEESHRPRVDSGTARAVQIPTHIPINPITPPVESNITTWNPLAAMRAAGMHSPIAESNSVPGADSQDDTLTFAIMDGAVRQSDAEDSIDKEDDFWVDTAASVLLENLRRASKPKHSLRILSHALPSTSTSGHIFAQVISAIHGSTPTSPVTPLTWINVFHAIPGRFNLADLPTSPPATPGPAIGGEDYFTQKIFDSAVSILDYQDSLASLPRSPRPVVPPLSIDISIVERYIPPSSSNEFSEMFDPNGSSILVDRLVELSADSGSLLFIYPTRSGAETFMKDYLGPILDPLLRTMAVVRGLSSDLCRSLGNMTAVHLLPEHETMQQRMSELCSRLSQRNAASWRFHGGQPTFTLSYASKKYVNLPRRTWAREWWTKQEKTRLKETINNHYREPDNRRRSVTEFAHQSTSPTVLLQELVDGVAGKPAQDDDVPDSSIEVSIFVITRSA